jgi:hypothetical protein
MTKREAGKESIYFTIIKIKYIQNLIFMEVRYRFDETITRLVFNVLILVLGIKKVLMMFYLIK